MSLRDWFLFVSTFFVAVLCGMYLYFTVFLPEYVANPVMQEVVERSGPRWSLSVQTYGGCAQTGNCSGFELNSRGEFRYQLTPRQPIITDSLPADLQRSYNNAIGETDLAVVAERVQREGCRSFVDGVDYTIVVNEGAESYVLDTCNTNFGFESPLAVLAGETFSYAANPSGYESRIESANGSGGLRGYLERKLDEQFSYDD